MLDVLAILLKRRRFLFWNTLIVTLLALGISLLLTPRFTATTTILPPQDSDQKLLGLANMLPQFDLASLALTGATMSSQIYVAVLKSRTVADSLIAEFDLRDRYRVKNMERARKGLGTNTAIKLNSNGVIQVSVTDKSPQVAADIANAYIRQLDSLNRSVRSTEGKRTREFVEARLVETRALLRTAEDSLLAFQERNPGLVLPSEAVASAGATADLMALRITLGYELEAMRSAYGSGAAPLARKEAELRALDRELEALPDMVIEMGRRYRDFKIQEKVFELLSAQLESARIKEAKDVATVDVLDVAIPPERKSFPRRGIITVLAFLVSIVVGAVAAVGLEALERSQAMSDPRLAVILGPGTLLGRLLGAGRSERGP